MIGFDDRPGSTSIGSVLTVVNAVAPSSSVTASITDWGFLGFGNVSVGPVLTSSPSLVFRYQE
jgi:hypothetical protein